MVTIKSIRQKLTKLKGTRRVRKMFLQEEILSDMVDLMEQRLGPDPEVFEVAASLGAPFDEYGYDELKRKEGEDEPRERSL